MVKFWISSPKSAIHQDCAWIAKHRRDARIFFSSGMADHALRLGPYM